MIPTFAFHILSIIYIENKNEKVFFRFNILNNIHNISLWPCHRIKTISEIASYVVVRFMRFGNNSFLYLFSLQIAANVF